MIGAGRAAGVPVRLRFGRGLLHRVYGMLQPCRREWLADTIQQSESHPHQRQRDGSSAV